MQHTEREAFGKLMVAIGELYHQNVSMVLIKLYWEVLKNFAWQDIVKSFEEHVKDPDTGQFMPKPADIIRVIRGNSNCQALRAWTKVEQAIRLVGPYSSVVFDDPIIHLAIKEMGGWIKLCLIVQKEMPFIGKEFQMRYSSYRYAEPTNYPNYLSGLNEHQNVISGFVAESPKLLGDQCKAQAIFNRKNVSLPA